MLVTTSFPCLSAFAFCYFALHDSLRSTGPDTVGTIYTFDTIPALPRQALDHQIMQVLNQTRGTYCKPRAEVEQQFREPPDESGGVGVKNPPQQPPDQPMSRWEELA